MTSREDTVPSSLDELHERVTRPAAAVLESLRQREGDFLVLGAGGKMGFHLCRMLQRALAELGRSNRVVAVSRFSDPACAAVFENCGITTRACDLLDEEQLRRLPEFPNVFFLAGVKFGTASNPERLERFNIQLPRMVAYRFREAAIVALSTGCVYAMLPPETGGSTENADTDPPGEYALSCLGREKVFIDAADEVGTRSVLIRLNYSVDLRYGVLVDIAQKVLAGEPVDVGMGYVNVIWQGDAVAYVIQALEMVSAPPSVLNVTGAEILRVRELARIFGRLLDRPVHVTGSEAPSAWLSNAVKCHGLYGQPSVPGETLIRWVAQWVAKGGETLGKPTHFENREGRYE